jgi:hypothetical protein
VSLDHLDEVAAEQARLEQEVGVARTRSRFMRTKQARASQRARRVAPDQRRRGKTEIPDGPSRAYRDAHRPRCVMSFMAAVRWPSYVMESIRRSAVALTPNG